MLERTGNHPRTPPSPSPMNLVPLPLTPGATERLPAIARTPPAVQADKSCERVDVGAASGKIPTIVCTRSGVYQPPPPLSTIHFIMLM